MGSSGAGFTFYLVWTSGCECGAPAVPVGDGPGVYGCSAWVSRLTFSANCSCHAAWALSLCPESFSAGRRRTRSLWACSTLAGFSLSPVLTLLFLSVAYRPSFAPGRFLPGPPALSLLPTPMVLGCGGLLNLKPDGLFMQGLRLFLLSPTFPVSPDLQVLIERGSRSWLPVDVEEGLGAKALLCFCFCRHISGYPPPPYGSGYRQTGKNAKRS